MQLRPLAYVFAVISLATFGACGDDTGGTGSGGGGTGGNAPAGTGGQLGTGGAGVGGEGTQASTSTTGGEGGEGGDDTVGTGGFGGFGTGGFGTGGGGDDICEVDLVADPSECVAGCDAIVAGPGDAAYMCTITCEVGADCSDDESIVCFDLEGDSVCLFDCSSGNACPNGFVCDQDDLICIPDQA